MRQSAAWIGLGVMGYPMAGHLKSKGGIGITVYNRTAEKSALDNTAELGLVGPAPKRQREPISSSPVLAMTMISDRSRSARTALSSP